MCTKGAQKGQFGCERMTRDRFYTNSKVVPEVNCQTSGHIWRSSPNHDFVFFQTTWTSIEFGLRPRKRIFSRVQMNAPRMLSTYERINAILCSIRTGWQSVKLTKKRRETGHFGVHTKYSLFPYTIDMSKTHTCSLGMCVLKYMH